MNNMFDQGLSSSLDKAKNEYFNLSLNIMYNMFISQLIDDKTAQATNDKNIGELIKMFTIVISTIPIENLHIYGHTIYPFISAACQKIMRTVIQLDIEVLNRLFQILGQGLHSYSSIICIKIIEFDIWFTH